jgi:mono/diheme cytochrome c family protein
MRLWGAILGGAVLLAASLALGQENGGLLKQGQEIFDNICADCHRMSGEGLPDQFPALKGNAFVQGDLQPVLHTVLHGRHGKLGQMPAWGRKFNDQEIAAVVSYVRNAWGNKASVISPADVAAARQK